MKKIILSLAIIAIAGTVTVGLTRAYFSDTETSTGNTFTAGTLDLNVNGQDQGIIPVVVGNIAPGWSKDITYTVKNAGSISGNLSLASGSVVNHEDGCNGAELSDDEDCATIGDDNGELGANIQVTIEVGGDTLGGTYTLNELVGATDIPLVTPLSAGAETTVVLHLSVNEETVGNEIQGDSVAADFTLALDQVTGVDESTASLTMENKNPTGSWPIITTDDITGTLSYNVSGPQLVFNFNGKVNTPSIGYTLFYVGPSGNYPYSGQLVLGTGTANSSGNITISGTVTPADDIVDGKVWLVPSAGFPTSWDPANILFEGTGRVNYTQI